MQPATTSFFEFKLATAGASTLTLGKKMNIQKIQLQAERIFLRPSVKYAYDDIIVGVNVCGKSAPQKAVGKNTFRGFYRKTGFARGASAVFDPYFIQQKDVILLGLKSISKREEFDSFAERIKDEIKARLTNVEERQLASYNKVRKPVDLYLEHIVAMSNEISDADRARLIPLLFLPLDSWIFSSPDIFTDSELSFYGLSRRSTYKDVTERSTYSNLHRMTLEKARSMSDTFFPIYFDLIWGDRVLRDEARNLFESNP